MALDNIGQGPEWYPTQATEEVVRVEGGWRLVAWHNMAWHCMVWCGMVWYDMAWHGIVWHVKVLGQVHGVVRPRNPRHSQQEGTRQCSQGKMGK